jgi:hypothetical protein
MRRSKTPGTKSGQEQPLQQDIVNNDYTLHEEWDREADRTIDESRLRTKPDWLEAIGDEDEDNGRIEQNIRDEWERRGEDDFVSDPTAPSDHPDWVSDDYDDENVAEGDNELDSMRHGNVRNSETD